MNRTILFCALAACNGEADDDATTPSTSDTGTPPTYEPTWDGVQALFADHCDRCHPSVAYLDLHTGIPYDLDSGYGYYVVPGDPDASLLWQLVSAPLPTQSPMPYDTGLLPAATVDPIRQWIADGAVLAR